LQKLPHIEHSTHEEIDAGHGMIKVRRAYAIEANKYKKQMPNIGE
jgi:hypothetical protein